MQKHEGVLFLARARAPATSNAVEWSKKPRAQIYRFTGLFTAVFIGFRTESWQGLIGCRSFLEFTNWLIFIGCRGFLVFTNWLLAAGGCLLRPDKLKPGYGEYAD